MILNGFKSKIFPIQPTEDTGISAHIGKVSYRSHPSDFACVAKGLDRSHLIILTPKQMLQRLSVALEQVKADNTSENLLNEIHQIIYSLYRSKKITRKVNNYVINSRKF